MPIRRTGLLAGTVLVLSFWLPLSLLAQKRPLDHDAYDIWQLVKEQVVSRDGRWVAYVASPDNGDPTLHLVNVEANESRHFERGANAAFSPNGKTLLFLLKPPREAVRRAKIEKVEPGEMPGDTLALFDLESGALDLIPGVQSFLLPKEAGNLVAIQLEPEEAPSDTTKPEEGEPESEEAECDEEDCKEEERSPWLVRDLATSRQTRIEEVREVAVAEQGEWVALTAGADTQRVDVVSADALEARTLFASEGTCESPVWDRGTGLAFLTGAKDTVAAVTAYSVRLWNPGQAEPVELVPADAPGLPPGWAVSEHGKPWFSRDGRRLFFGTAPIPEPAARDSIPDDEKVVLDVWSWQDSVLQSVQLERVKQERKRTYLAMVPSDGRGPMVQLARPERPEVQIAQKGNGAVGLANTDVPYRLEDSWDSPSYYDIQLLDAKTGEWQLVAEKNQAPASLSPEGKYVVWWDRDRRVYVLYSVEKGSRSDLAAGLTAALFDEDHDEPSKPDPYGIAGWTEGDEGILLYDRYDLWLLDPSGRRAPRCVTEGVGRAQHRRLRYIELDPEARFIRKDQPLLLSGFDEDDMSSGFYQDSVEGEAPPVELLWHEARHSNPTKARNAPVLVYTRETVDEFPDLWVADDRFSAPRRISDVNPQRRAYNWATVELVSWTSVDGRPIRGLLYRPEDFDAAEKYPMIVYFYERNAENLHQHPAQVPHRSIINPIFYASRGYLVFIPDIPYRMGFPGESAINAVMPGVTRLIDAGIVDPSRIGVQGHSWGGYQIAYMVTRTTLFRAAAAGAPVANMVSAYGGIRWESGLSRMFQYERTQSRIGRTLWEAPLWYIENSPVFWADKIETPLLILHNDHDGAVPWPQGIELFVALRRLRKPAWMINYNGEPHWPLPYFKRRDWQIRLQQFFDHYLKDAPAPVWMTTGIPAVRKGQTLGLERPTPE